MNQKGYSLISIIIATAISLGVMFALSRLFVTGAKFNRNLNENFDILDFNQALKQSYNLDCTQTLASLDAVHGTTVNALKDKNNAILLSVGDEISKVPKIEVESIKIENPRSFIAFSYYRRKADLAITLKSIEKTRKVSVPFFYEANPTNIIRCEMNVFTLNTAKNIWNFNSFHHLNTTATEVKIGNPASVVDTGDSGINASNGYFFLEDNSSPQEALYLSPYTKSNIVSGPFLDTKPATDGARNTLIGFGLGNALASTDNVVIGDVEYPSPHSDNTILAFNSRVTAPYNTVIGNNNTVNGEGNLIITSNYSVLSPGGTAYNNIVIGNKLGQDIRDSYDNVIIGGNSCRHCRAQFSVLVGSDFGKTPYASNRLATESIIIGSGSQKNSLLSSHDVIIGANLMPTQMNHTNIVIGSNEPYDPVLPSTPTQIEGYIVIGNDIGVESTFQGDESILIGNDLVRRHTDTHHSIVIGNNIGNSLTNSNNNILIGSDLLNTQNTLSNQLRIGNVFSGQITDPRLFQVGGSSQGLLPANIEFIHSTANCTLNGSLSCSSDRNLKKQIVDFDTEDTKKASLLEVVSYNWKALPKEEKSMGVIAQDVEAYFPEAVLSDKLLKYKQLKYESLSAPTIQLLKTSYLERNQLEKLINKKVTIQTRLIKSELKKRIEKLRQ